ncbi:MAG: PilZ domain-containing protein [Chitinispirillales bacterium]|jgi:hypothetical protein|nr:PilZ domain-containing protein [Chitinispirillales bacterium]
MIEGSIPDKRRLIRKVLCYYLKVIDLENGKEIGRVADITSEGMMIFGGTVLDKEKIYRVRVILGKDFFNAALGNLDVSVQIRWSKPDANPSIILTGTLFQDLDEKGKKIVKNLVYKIGMKRRLDITEEDIEAGILDEETY